MLELKFFRGERPKKLHFGCGTKLLEDHWNIDANIPSSLLSHIPVEDDIWISEGIILSPHSLPNNYFKEIFAEMVFEHIHPDMIPNTLYCLYHSLRPGGIINIIVPNFVQLARQLIAFEDGKAGGLVYHDMMRNINNEMLDPTFEDEGFFHGHKSIWTKQLATRWLTNEGYSNIKFLEFGENYFYLKILAEKDEGNKYGSPSTA